MTSKEIIINQIDALKEQAKIEKELKTGSEIYCEIEIEQYNQVLKDLEELEHYRKVKSYIEKMYDNPFYTKESGYIRKWIKGDDYYIIDCDIINDCIDIYEYEEELSVNVDELETKIIFPNEEIEKEYQKQQEKEMREYEERRKNNPVWYGAIFNGTSGGNK